MREYRQVVDREGRVLDDGTEIVDPLVLRFVCQGEPSWFELHDTPFVVQRLVSYPLKADRLSKTPSQSSGGGAFR